MDLLELLHAVARRWVIAAGVLALTLLVVLTTRGSFPPTVTVEADYLLDTESVTGDGPDGLTPGVLAAVTSSRGFGTDAPPPFDQMPYSVTNLEGTSTFTISTTWDDQVAASQGVDRIVDTMRRATADLLDLAEEEAAPLVEVLGQGVRRQVTELEAAPDIAPILPSNVFVSTATVAVRPPIAPANPYGPSDYTAEIVTQLVTAPLNLEEFLTRDGIETADVVFDARAVAPLIQVVVEGTDREVVLDTFVDLESEIDDTLTALQTTQIERGGTITVATPLARPDRPTLISSNSLRPLAIIVMIGLFTALGAALAVDSFMARRAEGIDGGQVLTALDLRARLGLPDRHPDEV